MHSKQENLEETKLMAWDALDRTKEWGHCGFWFILIDDTSSPFITPPYHHHSYTKISTGFMLLL
jgi:hypothetical protein